MKKKLLSVFLSLLTTSTLWAADGDTFTANTVEGLELTFEVISESEKTCLVKDGWNIIIPDDSEGSITIPSEVNGYQVKEIGNDAFSFSEITSITIPEGVTNIGDDAFAYCTSITSITIPDGVKSIGNDAFYGCTGLTSITIPESVTNIGEEVFSGCTGLTSITIPKGVTNISSNAFDGCTGLTNITIPEDVTNIGDGAFDGCSSLTSIKIPESVTTIGDYAFWGCSGLTSTTIPEGVTNIGDGAFGGCSSLTSILIPKSVTSIGVNAFSRCELTSIVVESGNTVYDSRDNCNAIIKTASNELIAGCKNTEISASVTTIGKYAFEGCKGLTSITIPNSVTDIGYDAFYDCTGLTNITIPESVTNIGWGVFDGCTSLASIIIPEGVTIIDGSAFRGCSSLTYITIPKSVKDIYSTAFSDCRLSSIVVESGNTVYDSRDNCNAIIKTASNELIVGCKNTEIPASVTTIGNHAFESCKGLTSITIPNSVTNIGDDAFAYCTGLTSIIIPDGVKSIGDDVFAGCTGLISITIPNSVTNIGEEVFSGCTGLTSITIPKGVTSIGRFFFDGCSSLTSIKIPEGVTSIGSNAFYDCSSLTSITIPKSVTTIGYESFSNCNNLKNVVILNEDMESMTISSVPFGYNQKETLYVPQGMKDAYTSIWWGNLFKNIIELDDADVTLGKNMVSFASEQMLDFSTPIEDLKAYIVSGISSDGKAIINEVTGAVPSGTGLILKGTAGHSYAIPYTTTVPDAVSNMLVGVTEDTEIGGNDLDYILSDGKFVKASYGTLPAGRAYLKLDEALARSVITIGDEITGIKTIDGAPIAAERYYNLNGQRVSTPQKGLYIVNGKKVAKK